MRSAYYATKVAEPPLMGLRGGFADGVYGYAMPRQFWKVARFGIAGVTTIQVLDLAALDPELSTFLGGCTDGVYGYALPCRGAVPRFDIAGFAAGNVIDASAVDPDLSGSHSGFTDGVYG